MNCQDADLNQLSSDEETSAEYLQCIAHLDQCPLCQSKVEQGLSADAITHELAVTLQAAARSDLEYTPSTDKCSLEFTFEADNNEPVPHQPDERHDIDYLQPAVHPELLGRLGRYDIERIVGRGGMGVVFRAYDSELHRVVALKVLGKHLTTTAAARQRFAREARAAAAVLHPNVLPIHDVEAAGPTPYLVMQYVSGCSLQTRIDRDGPLSPIDAMRIAKQTSAALAAAHQQGLIHRDVKPANILLEEGTDRVVLSDFGLARTADDASLTRTGIVAGTPHYMSPEQANGEAVSVHSDLFALGSVLFFMLSGRPPFRGESAMGVLHCVCTKKHATLSSLNPAVPRELSDVVDRLLAKKPNGRFPSAEVVEQRLELLLNRMQSGQLRIGPVSSLRKWSVRIAASVAGIALLAIAFNALSGLSYTPALIDKRGDESNWISNSSESGLGGSQPAQQDSENAGARPPASTQSESSFGPMIRSASNRAWDKWESELAELERDITIAEMGYDGQDNNLSNIFLAPDEWSAELDALTQEMDSVDGT